MFSAEDTTRGVEILSCGGYRHQFSLSIFGDTQAGIAPLYVGRDVTPQSAPRMPSSEKQGLCSPAHVGQRAATGSWRARPQPFGNKACLGIRFLFPEHPVRFQEPSPLVNLAAGFEGSNLRVQISIKEPNRIGFLNPVLPINPSHEHKRKVASPEI